MTPNNASQTLELSVLILCRNEERSIGQCIAQAQRFLKRRDVRGEIVVVDNGSEDRSATIARQGGARVIGEPKPGYGRAIEAGINACRGRFVILGDGDGNHDLEALDGFLDKLRDGFDFVVGNRRHQHDRPDGWSLLRRVGIPLLSSIGKWLSKAPVSDFHCGLRGFHMAAGRDLLPHSPGFEAASEMIVKAVRKNLRIAEVPVVQQREIDEGRQSHLRPWRDGWRHLRLLLMLAPNWLFLYPGCLLLLAGLLVMPLPLFNPSEAGGPLGPYGMLFGAAFTVLGAQLIGLYMSARAFYEAAELIEGRLCERWRKYHAFETCLVAGLVLVASGIGAGAWSLFAWATNEGVEIRLRLLIMAVTLVVLGTQAIFQGFLISLLVAQQQDGEEH